MLKRDHEILSACFVEEADGSLKVVKNPLALMQRGGPKSTSSGDSVDSFEERKDQLKIGSLLTVVPISASSNQTPVNVEEVKFSSPVKQGSSSTTSGAANQDALGSSSRCSTDMRKLQFKEKQNSQSFKSNLSSSNQASARSKDEITTLDEEEERKAPSTSTHQGTVSEFSKQAGTLADDKLDQKLQQQRLKVAVRRNILKRNLSEDLDWAAGL